VDMLTYLRDGMNDKLPPGHCFRYYSPSVSRRIKKASIKVNDNGDDNDNENDDNDDKANDIEVNHDDDPPINVTSNNGDPLNTMEPVSTKDNAAPVNPAPPPQQSPSSLNTNENTLSSTPTGGITSTDAVRANHLSN